MQGKWGWYAIALLIVLLDQASKYWIQAEFELNERVTVWPVFDLTLVYNTGAAWSMLSDAGGWQRWLLSGISVVASIALAIWIARAPATNRLLLAALATILGGAAGNLVDRATQGRVVDFLSFHYNDAYFPTFNLADSAITLGAFLMLLDLYFEARRSTGVVP